MTNREPMTEDEVLEQMLKDSKHINLWHVAQVIIFAAAMMFMAGMLLGGCATVAMSVEEQADGSFKATQKVKSSVLASVKEGQTAFYYEGTTTDPDTGVVTTFMMQMGLVGKEVAGNSASEIGSAVAQVVGAGGIVGIVEAITSVDPGAETE